MWEATRLSYLVTPGATAPHFLDQFLFTGPAGVGGGTTPGFSQILLLGLLSSTGVALNPDARPLQKQDNI